MSEAVPVQVQSFQELVAILKANQNELQIDDAEQALVIATTEAELGKRLIVRWEKQFPLIHIIQPMIAEVPAARATDVALAICRLNNVAKFPGLGYDQTTDVIYYRITLVTLRDGIRSDLLVGMLHGAVTNAKELLEVMRAVVAGASPEKAVAMVGG